MPRVFTALSLSADWDFDHRCHAPKPNASGIALLHATRMHVPMFMTVSWGLCFIFVHACNMASLLSTTNICCNFTTVIIVCVCMYAQLLSLKNLLYSVKPSYFFKEHLLQYATCILSWPDILQQKCFEHKCCRYFNLMFACPSCLGMVEHTWHESQE